MFDKKDINMRISCKKKEENQQKKEYDSYKQELKRNKEIYLNNIGEGLDIKGLIDKNNTFLDNYFNFGILKIKYKEIIDEKNNIIILGINYGKQKFIQEGEDKKNDEQIH